MATDLKSTCKEFPPSRSSMPHTLAASCTFCTGPIPLLWPILLVASGSRSLVGWRHPVHSLTVLAVGLSIMCIVGCYTYRPTFLASGFWRARLFNQHAMACGTNGGPHTAYGVRSARAHLFFFSVRMLALPDFPPLYVLPPCSTLFWVPFMTCNFALVAPVNRVKAMAVANMGWNVAIDFIAHGGIGLGRS
jgi:hypothetical protein